MAVQALDHLRAGAVVRDDELTEILGVQLFPECGRFDEIAEDDCQVPTLSVWQRLMLGQSL